MADEPPKLFVPIGKNPARPFGMAARDRACRLAQIAGFECADGIEPGRAVLLANMAYGWDPIWLKLLAENPRSVLKLGPDPVMAFVPADEDAGKITHALTSGGAIQGYQELPSKIGKLDGPDPARNEPFVLPLDPENPEPFERAAYSAAYDDAYHGIGDALTLYLFRKPAFFLTRAAAHAGLSSNVLRVVGALLGLFTFYLFWSGDYWLGALAGFLFMVVDIAPGKLASCTGAQSRWGNRFETVIDLAHPPFWWWAWLHGLEAHGLSFEPFRATMVLWIILSGYGAQRIVERLSVRRFAVQISEWRPLDSKFALVGAKTGPNLVILLVSLACGRPDAGLEMVAWWTLISLIFDAVRLAQMNELKSRGRQVRSWLEP